MSLAHTSARVLEFESLRDLLRGSCRHRWAERIARLAPRKIVPGC
jgi:hypothetical protein